MQIVHQINDFFYTIFPELANANEKEISITFQNYYTYGPFVPEVSVNDKIITINVQTEHILSQEADYLSTVALCEKGKFNEAKVILDKLIKINPSNSEYHRILGQILSEQGNQDEAINSLIDALRWNSSNGWALLMMGNIFAKHKKDLKTAMIYYDQAILANKADHITLANITYLMFQGNKLEEAKKYARETIKINEKYPNIHFILSLIAEAEKDFQSAFYSVIQTIKFSTQKDTLYQNAVKLAFDLANKIIIDFDGKKTINVYRSQLENEIGVKIDVIPDNSIKTAAKVEIAERYKRDRHIIKFKDTYPAIDHLVMHELVHIDFIDQARKVNSNKVFISTQQNKNNFIKTILPAIDAIKAKMKHQSTVDFYTEILFSGLNLQTYNTPIDVFIEDFLYKEHAELRPFQFISLSNLIKEAIKAVTDERILEIAPLNIISKTRTFSLVNAMQFKELFGIDTIQEFKPTSSELKLAESFFKEFVQYRENQKPGEEYQLVNRWAKELDLDSFFELESEAKFETKNNIDDFLKKLQQDPFGLDEPEDLFQKKEMEEFQKSQKEIGTNMAIVMFMVEALNHFKEKSTEDIKQAAFELAMLGTQGIDPNQNDYIISSISSKRFSGNQVLAFYYVSWALAMPDQVQHLGLDFTEEFEIANKLIS